MVAIAEVVKDREDVDVGVPIDNPFRIVVVDENFIDVATLNIGTKWLEHNPKFCQKFLLENPLNH